MKKIEEFAQLLGTTLDIANQKISEEIGNCQYLSSMYDKRQQLELVYFAIISLVKKCYNILEIGTGKGDMTSYLSILFPEATIYTFDIPADDKQYKDLAIRISDESKFGNNINKSNVRFFAKNSFYMPQVLGDKKFDLIWLDGGHSYPSVAWDIMYAYNHLNTDGYLFIHDYNKVDNDVKRCVDEVSSIIREKINELPFAGYLPAVKTCWIKKGIING